MRKPSRMKKTLSLLTLILSLMLLSTPSFATSCPNDSKNAERYELMKAKAGDASTPLLRLYDALAKKIKESCDLADQRNVAIDEGTQARTDRDVANGVNLELRRNELKLFADRDSFLVSNTLYEADNKRLKKQRWYWVGGAAVLAFVLGGGAALWVTK